MEKVLILLATYNGESYLLEQLASIEEQNFLGSVDIQVNDDCSSDNTLKILNEFKDSYKGNVYISQEKRGGHLENFMHLIRSAKMSYDYYMFADQDDFWLEDKISRSIKSLKSGNYTTYGSSVTFADESLKPMFVNHQNLLYNSKSLDKFLYTYVQGCTIMLKGEYFEKVRRLQPNLDKLKYHDSWVSLISGVTGNLYLDKNPTMLYRVHGKNVNGTTNKSAFKKVLSTLFEIPKQRKTFKRKIETSVELLRVNEKYMTKEQIREVKYFIKQKYLFFRIFTLLTFRYKPIGTWKSKVYRSFLFFCGAL